MSSREWSLDQKINFLIKKCVEGTMSQVEHSQFQHLSAERTRRMRPNFPPKRRRFCRH